MSIEAAVTALTCGGIAVTLVGVLVVWAVVMEVRDLKLVLIHLERRVGQVERVMGKVPNGDGPMMMAAGDGQKCRPMTRTETLEWAKRATGD